MQFEGAKRKVIAFAGLAVLAGLAWATLDAGRMRELVWVLLGGFGLRILLTHRSRVEESEPAALPE